jgi:hypothetical protein
VEGTRDSLNNHFKNLQLLRNLFVTSTSISYSVVSIVAIVQGLPAPPGKNFYIAKALFDFFVYNLNYHRKAARLPLLADLRLSRDALRAKGRFSLVLLP